MMGHVDWLAEKTGPCRCNLPQTLSVALRQVSQSAQQKLDMRWQMHQNVLVVSVKQLV